MPSPDVLVANSIAVTFSVITIPVRTVRFAVVFTVAFPEFTPPTGYNSSDCWWVLRSVRHSSLLLQQRRPQDRRQLPTADTGEQWQSSENASRAIPAR